MKECFLMDQTYRYREVPSKFGVVNEGFVRNSKIIINSDELLLRLMYMLNTEKDQILDYYNQHDKPIPETFIDILDFDKYSSQILIYGLNTLVKFIKEANEVYNLNAGIVLDSSIPYFFRNKRVGERMYLAVDVDSLGRALSYIYNWNTKGYAYDLPSVPDEEEERMNVTLYNFIDRQHVELLHEGQSKDKILIYKTQDRVRFVVLLAN